MFNRNHQAAFLGLAFVGLLGLPSCTRNLKYQGQGLNRLRKTTSHSIDSKNGVTVMAKRLTADDCRYYFNVAHPPYHVVQLHIDNQSDTDWILFKENIDLPLVSGKKAAEAFQSSLGYSVAMFFIPFVGLPISIAHGIFSYNANQRISQDVTEKSLETLIDVGPVRQRDVLLFTKKSSGIHSFDVTLVDANNSRKQLSFNLHL